MGQNFYVDFTAGSNGSGSTFSPFNSDAAMRSSGAVGGDTFFCKGPKSGPLDLGTLAGSSLAKPISVIGVTDLFSLDRSAPTLINASGSSYAITGSGTGILYENLEFKNSTGQTDQSSGSNVQFNGCKFSKGTGSATTVWAGYDRFYRGCRFADYTGTVLTLAGTYGAVVEDCEFTNVGKAVDSYGYRNITIRGNAIASATSDAITIVDNATAGTTYEVSNNSFGTIGGSAIVFGGNGNGDIMAIRNVCGTVTGTGIKITAGSPSGTTIGAIGNKFHSVGTNLGTNVNNLGLNDTLGSNPFVNAASDLTPASGSAIINAGYNGGSIGAMQAAAGGGSGGVPTIKGARPTMDVSLSETHIFDFITEDATGAAADATGTPTCQVFDNATDTPLLTPTVTKRTSQTGNYRVSVAFTSGNGFTVGNSYNLIAIAVIGGVTKKFNLAKVIVRTGNVDAVNATKIAGDATSATNLKNALNGTGGVTITAGLTGNVTGNLSGSVGSVTGAVGSVTGAVGSVTGAVGGNLSGNVLGSVSGSVGSVTGSVGSVTGAVGSVTGSVGGSVASVVGAVGSVSGSVAGDVGGRVLGGGGSTITGDGVRASSVTGAVGSVTGSVGSVLGSVGSVTGAVGSVTTTSNIATAVRDVSNSSPVAGSLGDKVNNAASAGDPWATNLPGGYASGTAGNILGNRLDATITSRSTYSGGAVASVTGSVGSVVGAVGSVTGAVGSVSSVSNIATAVRDVSNASPVAGSLGDKVNNAASAGDPWATSLPGAYGANTAGNILGNRLDVAVGTRSTFAGGAVASVTGAVGSVTGSVGSVVGSVGGNVSGSVASVAGNVGGSVASVTGNLGGNVVGSVGSVAGNVGGSVASVVGSVGSVVGSVGSVLSGVNLASTGLDSVFPETGINAKQTLSTILASVAGQLAGATTNTVVLRNPSGSAIRITATTDADGNRTAIVLNLAA